MRRVAVRRKRRFTRNAATATHAVAGTKPNQRLMYYTYWGNLRQVSAIELGIPRILEVDLFHEHPRGRIPLSSSPSLSLSLSLSISIYLSLSLCLFLSPSLFSFPKNYSEGKQTNLQEGKIEDEISEVSAQRALNVPLLSFLFKVCLKFL